MMLLDSKQILDAIARSLEGHVLPQLSDDFAKVQIASALKALQEVGDRLEHGDPCAALNDRIEQAARDVAEGAREGSPEFSARLLAALDASAQVDGLRARNKQMSEALWQLVSKNDDPAAKLLLTQLSQIALESANADNVYICGEAVVSLT
jgi:uncharacterized protein with ATP-grasp and redox domains